MRYKCNPAKYQNEKTRIENQFRISFKGPWGSSFFDDFKKFTLGRISFLRFSSKTLWQSTFLLKFLLKRLIACNIAKRAITG